MFHMSEADPGFLDRRGPRPARALYKLEKGTDCAHTALCTTKPLFL